MEIDFKITYKEYQWLLFRLAYGKLILRALLCVGAVMLVWIFGYYSALLPVSEPDIYQYITLGLITIVQPLAILWTIHRNYRSSNQLAEHLRVEFTPTQIKITGESFYTEIFWEKIYKIHERKNYFLIYQNTLSAIILPKYAFESAQIDQFRDLIRSLKDVDVSIKDIPEGKS